MATVGDVAIADSAVHAVVIKDAPTAATFTQAIKNLLTSNQADVETDLTGLSSVSAGATISRDTTQAWHGAASLKVVTDGTVASQGFRAMVAAASYVAGGQYTISVFLRGSGTVRLIFLAGSPIFGIVGAALTITLTGQWTRYTRTGTLPNPLTASQYGIQVDTMPQQAAITFNADGLQIESGAVATPWGLAAGVVTIADSAVQAVTIGDMRAP